MPTVISKLLSKGGETLNGTNRQLVAGAITCVALSTYTYKVLVPLVLHQSPEKCSSNQRPEANNNNCNHTTTTTANKKIVRRKNCSSLKLSIPGLNITFIFQFLRLLRIMVPNVFCTETALLGGHTIFLFLRTFLSIYVANLEGAIVKYIVRKEPQNFTKQLMKWFGVAIPATFINSMLRYLESRIALCFRTRLVDHSYRLYFDNQSYYRVTVLDSRLDNCAQRLTDDIETVANTVSHLYGQITKPLFDILLMALALTNLVRSRTGLLHNQLLIGPAVITGVVFVSALILRVVSPRFGHLVALEAEKRGNLRFVHSRIVANSEEIAFYGGHKVERALLKNTYEILCQHMELMFGVKLWFVMLEQFLMKYCWSGAGLIVVSLPILMSTTKIKQKQEHHNDSVAERTHYFTTAKNLLLTGSSAVERLMSSYKDVVELAGHTARVANMFSVLEEASRGCYRKTLVTSDANHLLEYDKNGQPKINGVFQTSSTINYIDLAMVPIVTPNCDVVCPMLNLHLEPGQHLLITGPNGCGKSSLFRILSGLWPIYAGTVQVPPVQAIFYIPQRPYMVLGNLRDQIIYPDTVADMINKQLTETDLCRIMDLAHLGHIVERDGLYQVKDWTDILSGGEKQRMAIARLFYHRPKYALLDECTSAVSIDVESEIYQTAIDMGITLLTITHRPTLWKFHTHILQFDGTGKWQYQQLNDASSKRLVIEELKREQDSLLRQETKSVEQMNRLQELGELLGEYGN